jgi:hypothetical protein
MATRPSTTIAINDGPAQPGHVEIEYDGRRHWHGHVTGIHEPGDHATITVHVDSDPETIFVGKALITSVRLREDDDPVTEFIGQGSLDRKAADHG